MTKRRRGWVAHHGNGEASSSDLGIVVVGTSALLALNDKTGKKKDGVPQTYVDVLPRLADEGMQIVIPQKVMEAATRVLIERGEVDSPVLKLLDDIENMRLPNMHIERSDPQHDSFNATKAAVAKYAGGNTRVFILSNSTRIAADRTSMVHLIAHEYPDVAFVTTTALVQDLVRTGLSHKFGVHNKHIEDITRTDDNRVESNITQAPPIDMPGATYKALEGTPGVYMKSGVGSLGAVMETIAATKHRNNLTPQSNGYAGGLDAPAESRVGKLQRQEEAQTGTATLER